MGVIGVPYKQKQAVDSAEYKEWSACSGQHDDNHNRHPADFTLSIFSSTEGISQYQNLNIENSNDFIAP